MFGKRLWHHEKGFNNASIGTTLGAWWNCQGTKKTNR